jgi:hypothetical protein
MQQTIKAVAAALVKRGWHQRSPGTWACPNMSVAFRPQDSAFVGHWTDGSHAESIFFDFPKEDPEQCYCHFVLLLNWADTRQTWRALPEEWAVAA